MIVTPDFSIQCGQVSGHISGNRSSFCSEAGLLSLFLGGRGTEVQLWNLIVFLLLVASHINSFRNVWRILIQKVVHGFLPVETHIMQKLWAVDIGGFWSGSAVSGHTGCSADAFISHAGSFLFCHPLKLCPGIVLVLLLPLFSGRL